MELQQFVYTTILDKDKYLICSLRVTERVKCCYSILSSKKYTKVKKVICIILIHFVIYVYVYCITYIGCHKVMIVIGLEKNTLLLQLSHPEFMYIEEVK